MPDAPATEKPLLDPQFLARLEQLELVSRKIFMGRMKGERRSKKKGQSVEFAVVLSDFMDKGGYEDALRYLVARQMDIYAIQILSQEEIEPEIVGDLKLVDVEDEDVAEVTVSAPLLKRYKQNLEAYRASLHEF